MMYPQLRERFDETNVRAPLRALSIVEQDEILPSEAETDLDSFRESLNAAYYPAFVDVEGQRPVLRNGRLNAAKPNKITVGFVRFGHQAIVDPGTIDGYHVNVPVAGSIGSVCGDKSVLAQPGTAAIFTPNGPTRLPFWSEDAAQLCLKVPRSLVDDQLGSLIGRRPEAALDFAIGMSLDSSGGRQWLSSLFGLVDAISLGALPAPVIDYLERAIVCQLLFAAHHSYSDELHKPQRGAAPQIVTSVMELIEGSPRELFTSADLARHAGVGVRRLEQAFRQHLEMTPSAFQAKVRLDRAHDDLLALKPGDNVTSIMYRWGFTNSSRFAVAYRARFGENPSATMKK
jgi:AraC-like DNA-binding protein